MILYIIIGILVLFALLRLRVGVEAWRFSTYFGWTIPKWYWFKANPWLWLKPDVDLYRLRDKDICYAVFYFSALGYFFTADYKRCIWDTPKGCRVYFGR